MCGITVYYSNDDKILESILDSLNTLQYRGYDSCGLACLSPNLEIYRAFTIEDLKKLVLSNRPKTNLAIAHTRWSTHGKPSLDNCHPISSFGNLFAVVHNGIITNYKKIREYLEKKGIEFRSQTDTESVVQLAEYIYLKHKINCFAKLIKEVLRYVEGNSSFIFISPKFPDQLVAVNKGMPLLLSLSNNIEIKIIESNLVNHNLSSNLSLQSLTSINFTNKVANKNESFSMSSDRTGLNKSAKKIVNVEEDDMIYINNNHLAICHLGSNRDTERICKDIEYNEIINEGMYETHMENEIHEQPDRIKELTIRMVKKLDDIKLIIKNKTLPIVFIGCGTSYHACLYGKQLFESSHLTFAEDGSSLKDRNMKIENSIIILFSQSGETADLIKVAKKYKDNNFIFLVVNREDSTLSRLATNAFNLKCGNEFSVAASKSFTSQISFLTLLSNQLNILNNLPEMKNLPDLIENLLAQKEKIENIAKRFLKGNLMLIGHKYLHIACLEGALKIKELSYIFSEAIDSASLKHGPLALIDESTNIILLVSKFDKSIENTIEEIKSRNGNPLIVSFTENGDFLIKGSDENSEIILATVFFQILAFYLAKELGRNVDRPRNLAKSVTVE